MNSEREGGSLAGKHPGIIFFEPDLGAADEKSVRKPALRALRGLYMIYYI